jgi:hypothetical protein
MNGKGGGNSVPFFCTPSFSKQAADMSRIYVWRHSIDAADKEVLANSGLPSVFANEVRKVA